MHWILLVYIYAGVFAKGDSVALQKIEGFSTQQACEDAAKGLNVLVNGSAKEVRHVCIETR
jgi:hypothetical protein